MRELGLDIAAHHDPRDKAVWYTEAHADRIIGSLRKGIGMPARPIYLQEPVAIATLCPPRCDTLDWDAEPLHARQAAMAARQFGAAA